MKKIAEIIKKIFGTIADCLVPTLPIMIGVGMLNVTLILLSPTVTGILTEDSNTYIVLKFVADAGFYFLPIFVAISSAKVFKTDEFLAGVAGAMLVSPTFVSLVNEGKELTIFGLKIASTNYGNQVITSIILIWIMSYITRLLDRILIDNLRPVFKPVLSIVIMVPIGFCLIGPLGVWLGDKLVELILMLRNIAPFGNAILCAIIPFITISGLGGANLSAMLLLSATGCDEILFFSNVIYNNVLGFVVLALYLRDKKPDTLASAITSAVAGTSEPALFGYAIKDPKCIISLCVGDFVGALYAGFMGVKSYAMASFGIFGIVTTIGPDSSILHAAIAIALGCITGFTLNFILHTNKSK